MYFILGGYLLYVLFTVVRRKKSFKKKWQFGTHNFCPWLVTEIKKNPPFFHRRVIDCNVITVDYRRAIIVIRLILVALSGATIINMKKNTDAHKEEKKKN